MNTRPTPSKIIAFSIFDCVAKDAKKKYPTKNEVICLCAINRFGFLLLSFGMYAVNTNYTNNTIWFGWDAFVYILTHTHGGICSQRIHVIRRKTCLQSLQPLLYIRMHYVYAPLFYVIVNFYFNFALGMLGTLPFVILGMLNLRADN